MSADVSAQISAGEAVLGIELGSTRIKACLVGRDRSEVLAVGVHAWESELVDGVWTYAMEAVWEGLRSAFADLRRHARDRHGVDVTRVCAIGISAMMHGYLALDAGDALLTPFRTWRNTSTGVAAAHLSEEFGVNVPLRWSVAHLYQAVLDGEEHVARLAGLTTLAGYVHRRLTGRHVLGVGDASGMFPIDVRTGTYDATMVARFDALAGKRLGRSIVDLLPEVLPAGTGAGTLTSEGALLLDPSGALDAGIPLCPPEGDAGTGMVATGAVAPGTGNVSAGTSIFAMVVLDAPLAHAHEAVDVVTTPAGDPVAMVHCNNGASELAAWADLFGRFAAASGTPLSTDEVFATLLGEALSGSVDAAGVVAYNHLAGEPIAGLAEGRPLLVRLPGSDFSLANLMRAQLYGVFGTLGLGMRVLHREGVQIDRMYAHGGMFRTPGVAQRFLAAALRCPVVVADTASEGGAWGMAVLAAFLVHRGDDGGDVTLADHLRDRVFATRSLSTAEPDPDDVAGFATYLDRYDAGLAVERAAVAAL